MKSTFLLCLMLIVNHTVFAKFYPGTIYLKDGNVVEAKVEPPLRPSDLYLSYSVTKGKLQSFKSEEVSSVLINLNKKQNVLFSYLNVRNSKNTRPIWVTLAYQTKKMRVYTSANEYYISENNYLTLKTSNLNGNEGLSYYLIKKEEESLYKAFEYYEGDVENEVFYSNLAQYFEDEPRLSKSVLKKEYAWKDIYKIAEIYSTLKEYRELQSK